MTPLFPKRKQVMKAFDQVTGEEIIPQPPKRYLMLITWTGDDDDWNHYWEKVTSREEVIRRVHTLRDDIEYDESYILPRSRRCTIGRSPAQGGLCILASRDCQRVRSLSPQRLRT